MKRELTIPYNQLDNYIGEEINPKYISSITLRYEYKDNPYIGCNLIQGCRGCGNTTRLVDFYIQELFSRFEEWVLIKDHYEGLQRIHYELIRKIKDRFELEHKRGNIELIISEDKKSLKLIKCK